MFVGHQAVVGTLPRSLYEKSFNFLKISQGDFGHFRENNQIILSQEAKIALRDFSKLKRFSHKSFQDTVGMHLVWGH